MPPKAYDLWPPILGGSPESEIDYFHAIEAFAQRRLMKLAGSIIAQMQRVEASGFFADQTKGMKSVWDEWCWYQAKYDNDVVGMSDAFEATLQAFVEAAVEELAHEEAVLLSCAAAEDHQNMPARDNHEIARVLTEMIVGAAGRRSMTRFEV